MRGTMSDGGKGDSMRPTDKRAFDEGMDRIFGKRPPWYVTREQRNKKLCPFCGEEETAEHNCQVPMGPA